MMFEGFLTEDFEAYLPEKWSSNMFTLPRRKVKDKLDIIGRKLSNEFEKMELPLTKHLSDDYPSLWNKKKVDTQWLFFSRDDKAQKKLSEIIDTERTLAATLVDPTPLYRHIFLGVSLNKDFLEIGLRLHYDAWVDRKNLDSLLQNNQKRSEFVMLCKQFPANFEMGLLGQDLIKPEEITDEQLSKMFAEVQNSHGWFFLGERISCAQTCEIGSEIIDRIITSIQHLSSAYKFIRWSPGNDAVSIDNLVAIHQKEISVSKNKFEKEQQERKKQRDEKEKNQRKLRQETEDRVLLDQEWRKRDRAARRAASYARREEENRIALDQKNKRSENIKFSENQESKQTKPPEKLISDAAVQNRPSQDKSSQDKSPHDKSSQDKSSQDKSPQDKHHIKNDYKTHANKSHLENQKNKSIKNSRNFTPNANRNQKQKNQYTSNVNQDQASTPTKKFSKNKPIPIKVSDERKADIRIGDIIFVKTGFLKGRTGIVHSIDDKGDLKISFGALTSRVAKKDIEGRGPTV